MKCPIYKSEVDTYRKITVSYENQMKANMRIGVRIRHWPEPHRLCKWKICTYTHDSHISVSHIFGLSDFEVSCVTEICIWSLITKSWKRKTKTYYKCLLYTVNAVVFATLLQIQRNAKTNKSKKCQIFLQIRRQTKLSAVFGHGIFCCISFGCTKFTRHLKNNHQLTKY